MSSRATILFRLVLLTVVTLATPIGAAHGAAAELRLLVVERGDARTIEVDVVDAAEEMRRLRARPGVDIVEVDVRRFAADGDADPLLASQWGLGAIGWSPRLLTADPTAPVAIIDSGFDLSHADLRSADVSRFTAVRNAVDGTADVTDHDGHGTAVASILGAGIGDGGMVGVSPHAPLLGIRIADDDGSMYVSDEVEAIRWAVSQGARVINLSIGSEQPSAAERQAIIDAVAAGVLVVAAAGNSGCSGPNPPEYPAAYPEVLAVASTGSDGSVACFSSRGSYVDVAAPGTGIVGAYPGERHVIGDGTSFSSPHVAGLASLLSARFPHWTPSQLAAAIRATATDVAPAGVDPDTGHGLVNLQAALALTEPPGEQVSTSVPDAAPPAPAPGTPDPQPSAPSPPPVQEAPAVAPPSGGSLRPSDVLEPNGSWRAALRRPVAANLMRRRSAHFVARVDRARDAVDIYRIRIPRGGGILRVRIDGRSAASRSRIDVIDPRGGRTGRARCVGGTGNTLSCPIPGDIAWLRVTALAGTSSYRVHVRR